MSNHRQDDQNSEHQSAMNIAGGRRKLLKLGVAATPVLMSLASRSAFACHSTTASAFGSVSNSRPELLQSSNGCSPNYWKSNSNWPSPYYSKAVKVGKQTIPATTFKSVFCVNGASSPFSDKTTLQEVLESSGGGNKAVARACVAALLNARSGKTPNSILSADDIINRIWHQFSVRSYYEPTAGIKWYSSTPKLPDVPGANPGGSGGIIGYLNTTWT